MTFGRGGRESGAECGADDLAGLALHLDAHAVAGTRVRLEELHSVAVDRRAELLLDRADDPDEPLYVFADPAGHPFCIFVG